VCELTDYSKQLVDEIYTVIYNMSREGSHLSDLALIKWFIDEIKRGHYPSMVIALPEGASKQ